MRHFLFLYMTYLPLLYIVMFYHVYVLHFIELASCISVNTNVNKVCLMSNVTGTATHCLREGDRH